jgi:hypothetical protein
MLNAQWTGNFIAMNSISWDAYGNDSTSESINLNNMIVATNSVTYGDHIGYALKVH